MKRDNSSNLDLLHFQELMNKQKQLITGLITVKSGLGMVDWGLKLLRIISAKAPTKSDVKMLKRFFRDVYLLVQGMGIPGTIKYLKTCSVALQQYVARDTTRASSRAIGNIAVARTRAGLPRIIPALQRKLIRRGDVKAIQLWLSLLNLYRYLESTYPEEGIYDTITKPGIYGTVSHDALSAISYFWKALSSIVGRKTVSRGPQPTQPHLIEAVSVAIRQRHELMGSSVYAVLKAIHGWRQLALLRREYKKTFPYKSVMSDREARLLKSFLFLIARYWPKGSALLSGAVAWNPQEDDLKVDTDPVEEGLVSSITELVDPTTTPRSARVWPNTDLAISEDIFGNRTSEPLGRLAQLREAAGKIRVIAIVDPMTNWVLKPIHAWIFSILGKIPQDGTFDQDAPINRLVKMNSRSSFIGSADMSSATDRLPVKLQEAILAHVLGIPIASAWRSLLVDRKYITPSGAITYAVGQPMGALSSWAMLALTHHFLWQWAAWRSGLVPYGKWYSDYAVLGDDSCSRHLEIVKEYLLICKELGVGINLSKSLMSPNGSLEFAKRFLTPKGSATPVSIGELFVSAVNFSVMSNWRRKHPIRPADLLAIMGYRFKACGSLDKKLNLLPKRIRNMILVLRSPWGAFPSANMGDWLKLDRLNSSNGPSPDYPLITVLQKLFRLKQLVIKRILNNSLYLNYYGTGNDSLTKKARYTDPKTTIALLSTVYDPVQKAAFEDLKLMLRQIDQVLRNLLPQAFYMDLETSSIEEGSKDIDMVWKLFIDFEARYNNTKDRVYEQKKLSPFVPPSPKAIVKLWNTFHS